MTSPVQRLAPSPFAEPPPLPKPGLLARLLRRPRPRHAECAIQGLLASTSPTDVSDRAISELLRDHHVTGREAHAILVRLWARALEEFLADNALSEEEVAYLTALQRAFNLSQDDVMRVEVELIHPRFKRALTEVLADHRVTPEEREGLAKLGSALRISSALQTEMFRASASTLLHALLRESIADRRLSPDEQENLAIVARQLGVTVAFDDATERLLARYALLWRIENGELPTVGVPIQLQRGEVCHFMTPASWHEIRKTTRTIGYYSQGVSLRIARGVYYRVGASRPQRITTEGLTEIDTGTLYLTSKRVLFDGTRKNTAIRLGNLISYQVFADGIALEKASGRSPYLLFNTDVELAAVILGRLLATA